MKGIRPQKAPWLITVSLWTVVAVLAAESRYFYDDLSRLVRVERPDGIVVTYAYDAVGNRLTKTVMHDADFDGIADGLDNCPTTRNTDQANGDGDVAGDACDCAPANAGAFAVPGEVEGLLVASDGSVSWNSAVPAAGTATMHDVLRGSLGELPVGDKPSETCLAPGVAGTVAIDAAVPAVGEGFWYLVRGINVCAVGAYGAASDGTSRSSAACP